MLIRKLYSALYLGLAMNTAAMATNADSDHEDAPSFASVSQAAVPNRQDMLSELSALRRHDDLLNRFIQFLTDGGENNRRELLVKDIGNQMISYFVLFDSDISTPRTPDNCYDETGIRGSDFDRWYSTTIANVPDRQRAFDLAIRLIPSAQRGFQIIRDAIQEAKDFASSFHNYLKDTRYSNT